MDGVRPYGHLCLFRNEVRANRAAACTPFYAALETPENWGIDTKRLIDTSVQKGHCGLFSEVCAGVDVGWERFIHFLPKSVETCGIS